MEHNLNLQAYPFDLIKSGKKTVEFRLYDEKRQKIRIGDTLFFSTNGNSDNIVAKVIGLAIERDFETLLSVIDTKNIGTTTAKETIELLEQFYPKEMQSQYSVVGIKFQMLSN